MVVPDKAAAEGEGCGPLEVEVEALGVAAAGPVLAATAVAGALQ
jgi:hypothetical protein